MIATQGLEAHSVVTSNRRWNRGVLVIGVVAAIGLGLVAGSLAVAGTPEGLAGLFLLLVPFAVWRWPAAGVYGLGSAGLVIEQYRIGAGGSDFTDHIPLFVSLSESFHLSGGYINLAEVGIICVLGVLVARAGISRSFTWPSGSVGVAYVVMLGAVAFAVVHGVASGGNTTMILWEVRPFLYLSALFLLALQLEPSMRLINAFFWCLVVGTGIKAMQGLIVLIPILASGSTRPEFLLSHDDAFFFAMDIVLVLALWLFGQKSRLRTVATLLLPLVFVINMANSRRAAWLILVAGLAVMLAIFVVRVPARRALVFKLAAVGGVAFALYLPFFWNSNGILAQPARAVRSTLAPSQRDQLSDVYRIVENANLTIAIRGSTPLGAGFGSPIEYVIPNIDLTSTDPFIRYITHDGILYVWWRTGWLGFIAWWTFIAFVMVSAVNLARARDLRLACFASVAAACVTGYVIEGYYDFGLFFFRMAFFMGLVMGLTLVAHRIEAPVEKPEVETVVKKAA